MSAGIRAPCVRSLITAIHDYLWRPSDQSQKRLRKVWALHTRLGHASIRATLDVYGHRFDGMDRGAAGALDEALANPGVGLKAIR